MKIIKGGTFCTFTFEMPELYQFLKALSIDSGYTFLSKDVSISEKESNEIFEEIMRRIALHAEAYNNLRHIIDRTEGCLNNLKLIANRKFGK